MLRALLVVLALAMQLLCGGADRKSAPPGGLESPDLAARVANAMVDQLQADYAAERAALISAGARRPAVDGDLHGEHTDHDEHEALAQPPVAGDPLDPRHGSVAITTRTFPPNTKHL